MQSQLIGRHDRGKLQHAQKVTGKHGQIATLLSHKTLEYGTCARMVEAKMDSADPQERTRHCKCRKSTPTHIGRRCKENLEQINTTTNLKSVEGT